MKSSKEVHFFQNKIRNFYKDHKRSFPWRETHEPYRILVSEMMLQQTQTSRVIEKYKTFLRQFSSFKSLAHASQRDVLKAWQGLGYNRRAFYLKKTAEIITTIHNETLPSDEKELIKLPGIGVNTAGALLAFAYNKPVIFIETNIRRVFLHEFFKDKTGVSDKLLFPLLEKTLDKENPREWYYALMDYGAYLSKVVENPNRKSAHYKKQSKFEGSLRQARGKIIKLLLENSYTYNTLRNKTDSLHFDKALEQLLEEGVVKRVGNTILLS